MGLADSGKHPSGSIVDRALESRWIGLTRRFPDALPILLLALIAGVLLLPYLFDLNVVMWPRSGFISDLVTYNWTSAFFARQHIAETGTIPLWWDTTMGGLPMVGNPSARIWYPPMLVAILLPTPLLQGLTWGNWLNLAIAGVGTYVFLRQTLTISRTSALAGSIMMMLTPRLSANLVGDMVYTAGLCWTPLALLCVRMALDRASFRWALGAGLCLGLMFTINFVNVLYIALLTALYAGYVLLRGPRSALRWGRLVVVGGVMALSAAGAAAPTLFPLITYLPHQSRQAFTLADANYLALPPALLVDALYPNPFKFPEWTFHVGLLPLALALIGLRHPSRRDVALLVFLCLFALIFAVGSVLPLYTLIVSVVPGFNLMRVPPRILIFASFGLVCLAALGVERLRLRRVSLSWRWLPAAAALAVVSLAIRYLTRRPDELDWLLGLPAAAALIGGLAAPILRARRVGLILIACLLIELFPLAASYMGPEAVETIFATPAYAEPMVRDRQSGAVFRTYSAPRALADHVLTLNDLQSLDGLNSFQFRHFTELMSVVTGCPLSGIAAAVPACASAELQADAYRLTQPDPVLLGLLNVRYVIAPDDHPLAGLTEVAALEGVRVYRNEQALPRAYFLDPEAVEQVERRVADLADRGSLTIPYTAATVRSASGGVFDLMIDAPAAGLLVIAETWTPGWSAWVDGVAAPIERAFDALIGVHIEPGSHQLRVAFEPPTFVLGVIVWLVTHAGAGAALFGGAAWKKRRERTSDPLP